MTDLVEAVHAAVARLPWSPTGAAASSRTRGPAALVYRGIRGTTAWVGACVSGAIGLAQPLLDRITAQPPGAARDALVAALNGVIGDHLAASANPLALPMAFRRHGRTLPAADGGRMLLLIHGLCMHDGQWRRHGHDHGEALSRDLGYRPAYLRYNTGLSVATNGRLLAERLEAWIGAASEPVTELAIVGYSLGGLVARSACHHAAVAGHRWPALLKRLAFLGTPHHGAPLERGGHWVDLVLGMNRYSAPFAALGRLRSAGITDLRHGRLLDEYADGKRAAAPHLALPDSVTCAAIAASTGRRRGDIGDRLLGDGLVPVDSALGRHADPARTLHIAADRQWIGYGLHHLDLLDNTGVYRALRRLLTAPRRGTSARAVARNAKP